MRVYLHRPSCTSCCQQQLAQVHDHYLRCARRLIVIFLGTHNNNNNIYRPCLCFCFRASNVMLPVLKRTFLLHCALGITHIVYKYVNYRDSRARALRFDMHARTHAYIHTNSVTHTRAPHTHTLLSLSLSHTHTH